MQLQLVHSFQLFILLGLSIAQECSFPSDFEVKFQFASVNSLSSAAIEIPYGIYTTCLAQAEGSIRWYRQLSLIIPYTYNGSSLLVKQFELECGGNSWIGRVGSVTDVPDSFNYTSITARTDCNSCHNTAGNDNHCEACNPACNTGSMKCTGPEVDDCCPVFRPLFQDCTQSCDENYIVGEFTRYTCSRMDCTPPDNSTLVAALESHLSVASVTLRGGPYYTCQAQGLMKGTYTAVAVVLEYTENGMDRVGHFVMSCVSGGWFINFSTNFGVSAGDTSYNGNVELLTNCEDCSSSGGVHPCRGCPDKCNVRAEGLNRCSIGKCCLAFEDDGWCKSDLNCNKENYIATKENNYTCSCELSCPNVYSLDSINCTCILNDICVADNPCSNGGTCELGSSPHPHYTCHCVDYYSGINCTECSLECLNEGSVDDQCMSCNCAAGYAGTNCSECDNGYGVNINGGCTLLSTSMGTVNNGTTSGKTEDNSSFQWWHVGLPVVLLVVLLVIVIVVTVGVLIMKKKEEKQDIAYNEIILKPQ